MDALVDFSSPDAVFLYGEEVRKRKLLRSSSAPSANGFYAFDDLLMKKVGSQL